MIENPLNLQFEQEKVRGCGTCSAAGRMIEPRGVPSFVLHNNVVYGINTTYNQDMLARIKLE